MPQVVERGTADPGIGVASRQICQARPPHGLSERVREDEPVVTDGGELSHVRSELVDDDLRQRDRPKRRIRLEWAGHRRLTRNLDELTVDDYLPSEEVDVHDGQP